MKKGRLNNRITPVALHNDNDLNKNSAVPLYTQLASLIRTDITKGKLKRGDTISTEKELEALYGVSRITVRGALAVLVEEGLIYRKKGRGTIVKQEKLTRQAPGLLGIHEEIRQSGRDPKTKLVSFEIVHNPPPEVRKSLSLQRGDEAMRLEREVYSDDELLGVSIAFIPFRIWEKTGIQPEQLGNLSLYRLLGDSGFKLYEAEETIEVITANKKIAKQLDVPKGFPLFYLNRTVYTKEGIPIECGLNIFRADKYQFKMHHWRPVNP